MKYQLLLEEIGLLGLAIYGLYAQPLEFAWWAWALLFLLPDVGMLGYLVNTEVGAVTYNLVHHRLMAVALLALGYYLQQPYFILAGWIVLGHASMDRTLGYGLKFPDSFKHTHLGGCR